MTEVREPAETYAEYQTQQEELRLRARELAIEEARVGLIDGRPYIDWTALRAPFPPEQIGKLPKGKGSGDKSTCAICGTYHYERGIIHLDYIGHAWLTERLDEFGGDWEMVPGDVQYFSEDLVWMQGTLIIGGVKRHEVGCADPRLQEWPKLLWSDTLTRCCMRHGIGLALWQKDTPTSEPREVRSSRPTQAATTTRAGGAASGAQQRDPDLEAVLALLQDDVTQLDQAGLDAWAGWKAEHARWWLSIDAAVSARDYVMGLLQAGSTEPWDPTAGADPAQPVPGGTDPY